MSNSRCVVTVALSSSRIRRYTLVLDGMGAQGLNTLQTLRLSVSNATSTSHPLQGFEADNES